MHPCGQISERREMQVKKKGIHSSFKTATGGSKLRNITIHNHICMFMLVTGKGSNSQNEYGSRVTSFDE